MENMFSGNQEKRIPTSFKDCYKTDAITQNLWVWCERLEKLGKMLFWALIIIGIINTITSAIDSHQFLNQIGADTIEEIRKESAKLGIEIPTVFETLVHNLLLWTFYAILEYCAYHVLALLVSSLASIVQHNRISANISLYKAAKDENINDDYEEEKAIAQNQDIKKDTDLRFVDCQKCGGENAHSQMFCQHCGASLKISSSHKTNNNSHIESFVGSKEKSIKCPCGARYYGDKCPNCGRDAK